MIRPVKASDAIAIAEIYNYYITDTIVTFEETPIDSNEILSRIESNAPDYPWLVYEENGNILGYAYASQWNKRIGYRFTVESTIYLRHGEGGKGIGKALYQRLIDMLIQQGMWTIIGGIALPNPASIALHEKLGYEKAAHYKNVGIKFGKWIDVVYYQLQVNENARPL